MRRRPLVSGKTWATAFSAAMIGLTLWPIVRNFRDDPDDGFPFSRYAMFSRPRADRQRITHLMGTDARGSRSPIPSSLAGPGGMNQMRMQIRKLVRQGQAEALCRAAAEALAKRQQGRLGEIVTVEVVTGTYSLKGYFSGADRSPLAERVHARCDVDRAARHRRP